MPYIAPKRICVNADSSKVVDCNSTEAAFLLVGEGGELTDEQARKYGLTKKAADEEEKAQEKAPANKAVASSPENKAKGK